MELEKEGLRIAQTPGRGEVGPVAGGPQTAHQTGFGPTFERGEQGNGPSAFQILTETATCEQQGHRRRGQTLASLAALAALRGVR